MCKKRLVQGSEGMATRCSRYPQGGGSCSEVGLPQALTPCTPTQKPLLPLPCQALGASQLALQDVALRTPRSSPSVRGEGRDKHGRQNSRRKEYHVLEGQGSIFFSYSHHNVSVIEGQTCLGSL